MESNSRKTRKIEMDLKKKIVLKQSLMDQKPEVSSQVTAICLLCQPPITKERTTAKIQESPLKKSLRQESILIFKRTFPAP